MAISLHKADYRHII